MTSSVSDFLLNFFDKDSSEYHSTLLEYTTFAKSPQARRTNFESWLYNNEGFKSYVSNLFLRANRLFLGPITHIPPGMIRKFVTFVQNQQCLNNKMPIVFLLEENHIKERLHEKLRNTHSFYRRQLCSQEDMNGYMEALRVMILEQVNTKLPDVERCVKQVVELKCKELMIDNREEQHFVKTYTDQIGEDPSTDVLGDFQDFVCNKERLLKVYMQYRQASYDFNFDQITREFLRLFGRDITVYELRSLQKEILDGQEVNHVVREYHSAFRTKYEVFEKYYKEYLTRSPELTEFVRSFANDVRTLSIEDFESVLQEHIVQGDEYLQVTTKVVRTFFEESKLSSTVHDNDVNYFVSRLKQRALSVRDQQSIQLIHEMYDEWTKQKEELESIFLSVLDRPCESSELTKFVEYYRWDDNNGLRPKFIIEEELYASLEYQDVVKGKLAQLVPNLGRAALYNIMSRGIQEDRIKTLRSEHDLNEFVQAMSA